MGLTDSRLVEIDSDVQKIKTQLTSLKRLDANNDGIITKSEFLSWEKSQQEKMKDLERKVEEQLVKKYDKILSDKNAEISTANKKIVVLTKQIETLKNLNNILDTKHYHETEINEFEEKQRQLSKEKVNEL